MAEVAISRLLLATSRRRAQRLVSFVRNLSKRLANWRVRMQRRNKTTVTQPPNFYTNPRQAMLAHSLLLLSL
jgi:hypothetical protein